MVCKNLTLLSFRAGIGTIVAFMLIGHFSDARVATATHAFDAVVITQASSPSSG
jgi:ACS family hexuronate transporter-like MFS transporter